MSAPTPAPTAEAAKKAVVKIATKMPPKGLYNFGLDCARNIAFLLTVGLDGLVEILKLYAAKENLNKPIVETFLKIYDGSQVQKTGKVGAEKSSTTEIATVLGGNRPYLKATNVQHDVREWIELLLQELCIEKTPLNIGAENDLFNAYRFTSDVLIFAGSLTPVGAFASTKLFKKLKLDNMISTHIIIFPTVAIGGEKVIPPHDLLHDEVTFKSSKFDVGFVTRARIEHDRETDEGGHFRLRTARALTGNLTRYHVTDANVTVFKAWDNTTFSSSRVAFMMAKKVIVDKGPLAIDEEYLDKVEKKEAAPAQTEAGNEKKEGSGDENNGNGGDGSWPEPKDGDYAGDRLSLVMKSTFSDLSKSRGEDR